MPVVWRYLLNHYLKVFFLSLTAIIAVLLTTRLDEIAHFAGLGAQPEQIFLFILYQLPYILPIAIPISGLISIIVLIKKLSSSHELTAFRACGISIIEVLLPVMIVALFLSFINFYIVSELATKSHFESNSLKAELRTVNPLLILKNKHLMRLKGVFFEGLGASRNGEYIDDAILAFPNNKTNRMNLMIAHKIAAEGELFKGNNVTFITTLSSDSGQKFDPLVVENMQENQTSIETFSQLFDKKVWSISYDYLQLPYLYIHIKELKKELAQATKTNSSSINDIKTSITKSYTEIVRRVSGALSVLVFTFMGAAFAMGISRHNSNRGIFYAISLATFYLIAYFAAKGFDHFLILSSLLYLGPLCLIMFISAIRIQRIAKGIE